MRDGCEVRCGCIEEVRVYAGVLMCINELIRALGCRALSGRNAQQTQAAVYRMLVNVHTWTEFSNHNAPSCPCSCHRTFSPSSAALSSPPSATSPWSSSTSQPLSSSSSSPSYSRTQEATPMATDPVHYVGKRDGDDANDINNVHADDEQRKKKRKCRCHCSSRSEASLEGIHDTLHNLLGGGGKAGKGHMASPAVAGAY